MDFFIVIRIMIWIIIVTVAWFFGRLMVLPALKIFPNMPPEPIIKGAYTVVLELTKAIFHYILIFLLIMYIIYCIIRLFVPPFILFIPLRQPLLDLPPLYELRVSGIFPLMDRLVDIIFSSMPFTQRLLGTLQAVGKFMATSVGYIFNQINFVKIGLNQKLAEMQGGEKSGKTQKASTKSTEGGTVQSRSEALKKKRDPDSADPLMENEGGAEPTFKPNYSKKANIYVENEYQRCIEKNYKQISPEMSLMGRLQASLSNNNTSITCGVQKLKHYSKIKAR